MRLRAGAGRAARRASPRTHCARSLSGVQIRTSLDARVGGGERGGRGERVVGLELDHRPHREAHRARAPPRADRNCDQQRGVDARAGLVAGAEVVAERLDHVVGRDADVGRAVLEQADHRGEDAAHGARPPGRRASVVARHRVEVPEQLVGAVDQVDAHGVVRSGLCSSVPRDGVSPGQRVLGRRDARGHTGHRRHRHQHATDAERGEPREFRPSVAGTPA